MLRFRLIVVLVGCVLFFGSTAAAQTVTLERLLSAPFPTEMTAAPTGARVAWVMNAKGVRNIWLADGPEYKGRRLTSYAADDGQDITGLTWSPDGATIVFVRGGGANSRGEIPNPTSDPEGVEQTIWAVNVADGTPRKLGAGSAPTVSPKGDSVAFLARGQVWAVALDGKQPAAQLIKARGTARSLRWSPDGSKLAFVSGRGDHSFIGVYEFAAKSLKFLTPSIDLDHDPVWSPDGKTIAFVREPNAQFALPFVPRREAEPWSIRVADVATNEGREVWRAERGRGSYYATNLEADNDLFWCAGDKLVFPWERDGWLHLYSVSLAGGAATLLTPGNFEVEYATLAADRASIVFNSNQDDIDRRHLWRVAASGGKPEALTPGTGIEWSPAPTADGGALAFFKSDARHPAHPMIRIGKDLRELAPGTIPSDFPSSSLVEPQAVTLSAADGMKIPAQLFLPTGAKAGDKRPAAIFFHGGSRRQMLLGFHYLGYYHNAYALNQYLASKGFVVLSVNYRSGTGYGMDFREALNYGAAGASEYNDVIGAGLYLQNRPEVDGKRIALWGGSYGGYLTALGLARASDMFAAGVDIHGVHDWNVGIRTFVAEYNPMKMADFARRAYESSPMADVARWKSPVLLIHGDDDRNVDFAQTVTLAERLRQQNVTFEQLILPDEVHGFLRYESWLAVLTASAGFLERNVGK